jgi:hypothetical protein
MAIEHPGGLLVVIECSNMLFYMYWGEEQWM